MVYETLPNPHEVVNHSAQEYVRGDVHTNGAESFWSMLKRAHKGTFHKMSPKHLDRYVQEFAARHNLRDEDTIDIMAAVITGMNGMARLARRRRAEGFYRASRLPADARRQARIRRRSGLSGN